ncbi:MAG: hypothetical protein B7C24_10160 [Bacteroidetes bacterium 4572_77]|nr:MAG: hypothetical protein B7C24_10160 [Bacteroidetes bacterium 4572_77]
MKLAVLTVFKNEADVLPAWLKHYEDQVDYFLFRDNESTDDGFKIAKNHPKTVFIESVEGPFQTNMWDGLIEEAQKYLSHEDWFTIAAPDLFPFYNMKQEINRVGLCNCIETHYPIFFFTDEMYKKYEVDRKYRQQIDKFDIENYKYFKVTGRKMPLLIKNVFNNGIDLMVYFIQNS